jgi:dihydrofolate reductase
MIISLIVAMAHNRVIGKDNGMPWHLPADLKHFKQITTGKPVIMGRKTFESIGKALPNRRNIVVSRNAEYQAAGCEVVTSLEAALALVKDAPEICIIGGAQLFEQALPMADRLYMTFIDLQVEGDTFFPDWKNLHWHETEREFLAIGEGNSCILEFVTLDRI